MSRIEDLIERIRDLGSEVEFSGPQSDESVAALEAALGIKLPPSYIDFLKTYGGGGVEDGNISGIFYDKPLMPNEGCVYGDTIRWRSEYGLPNHLVVVHIADGEEAICLDTSREEGDKHSVVRVDLYGGGKTTVGKPQKEAPSFSVFFEHFLEIWAEG